MLSQRDRYISVPKHEEVFTFAGVECLAHVLNHLLFVLDKRILVCSLRVAHLFLQHFNGTNVAVF